MWFYFYCIYMMLVLVVSINVNNGYQNKYNLDYLKKVVLLLELIRVKTMLLIEYKYFLINLQIMKVNYCKLGLNV